MTLKWLRRLSPPGERRFVYFPPAAGRADAVRPWTGELGPGVELWTVVLPGRDRRMSEPLERDVGRIVQALLAEWNTLPPAPSVFFGHSMGTLLAYDLIHELTVKPSQLLVAAYRAPHVPHPRPMHHLGREAFVEALRRMGGTPEELINSKELLDLFEPIIRADAAIAELYPYRQRPPLEVPIVAWAGLRDPVIEVSEVEGWAQHTSKSFDLVKLDAQHFFPTEPGFTAQLRERLRW